MQAASGGFEAETGNEKTSARGGEWAGLRATAEFVCCMVQYLRDIILRYESILHLAPRDR